MDVSVVVTCWNGRELLEKNLPFWIKASENPKNKIKEIIVVDDGSTDDSANYIESIKASKHQSIKVKLVKHEKNLGYSATCNTGVKEAKGDLVAMLNLDVIPQENFLEASLPHFEDEEVFSVSFNEEKFGPGKLMWKNGFLEIVPTTITKETSLTDWPNGGSSIFKKAIWEELGGMDKLFLPFYFEDIDLGLRARKAGYVCLWEPKSQVEHQHEATINKENLDKYGYNASIEEIKQRNHLILTWKNIDSLSLLVSHFWALIKRCIFHPRYGLTVFLAIIRLIKSSH